MKIRYLARKRDLPFPGSRLPDRHRLDFAFDRSVHSHGNRSNPHKRQLVHIERPTALTERQDTQEIGLLRRPGVLVALEPQRTETLLAAVGQCNRAFQHGC